MIGAREEFGMIETLDLARMSGYNDGLRIDLLVYVLIFAEPSAAFRGIGGSSRCDWRMALLTEPRVWFDEI